MPFNSRSRRQREPVVVQRSGRRTLDGIIAAAAAITLADGIEQPDERRGLLRFLRDNGLMGVLGRGKTLALYRAELDSQRLGNDVSARLRSLAGTLGAPLIASGALSVAASDGVIGPEEQALLGRVYAALNVSPARPVLG